MRPDLSRIPVFYHNYINQVPENELMQGFISQEFELFPFLERIPDSKYDFRYAEGKWSLKEVLQHIIDGERIFCYRALRFARKDTTPLAGFEENFYTENSKASSRTWSGLVEEFRAVRKATEYLFASFDEDQLNAEGLANNNSHYVLGIGFVIIGHANHHKNIMIERYL
jgi:hypothetical protein